MSKEVVIIDYGMGNLHSVTKAIAAVGGTPIITADKEVIAKAEKIILPGVGAFGDCMANLHKSGLVPLIMELLDSGKPFLGICLGMQVLFEGSDEAPGVEGLGYFKGQVKYLQTSHKIPHMGWNDLTVLHDCALSADVADGDYVYFVHSYRAETSDEYISCYATYNEKIPGLVFRGNVYGAQFHPEKSGQVGMQILKNFAKLVTT